MTVSREEARDIGQKVAEKVIKSAQGCRCGMAVWDARTNITSLENIILYQQPTLNEPLSKLMQETLTLIEQDCGLDIAKAREIAARIKHDIERKEWGEARVDLALMTGAIRGPFEECAAGEE